MPDDDLPIVRVKPHSYRPTKADLEENMAIPASPEEVARAVMRHVRVVEEESE